MSGKIVLGIHSSHGGANGSSNDLIDGHAWITITENGKTTSYGSWPDSHPNYTGNGDAPDIHKDREDSVGEVNRYYELTPKQLADLNVMLKGDYTWSETNNCASFVENVLGKVGIKDINANDILPNIETPRALEKSIRELEKNDPTTKDSPAKIPTSSSSFKISATDDTQSNRSTVSAEENNPSTPQLDNNDTSTPTPT